jgi:hypothetical protein
MRQAFGMEYYGDAGDRVYSCDKDTAFFPRGSHV